MDGQRQQYIPGPPPSMSQPSQSHPMNLPPPPPRHPPTLPQTIVPPPPPGPPPGTGYGLSTGWQQSWGRQGLNSGFPPPPPPPPLAAPGHTHPQHFAYARPPAAPLSVIPPPPPSETQPLTSATYIPGNDTLGVGIPPLFESHGRVPYEGYSHLQRPGINQSHEHLSADGAYGGGIPHSPVGRSGAPSLPHNNVYELVTENAPPQNTSQVVDFTKTPSHRHNNSGASLGGLSPSEAAIQWPLDRVLLWLAKNGFSKVWQETFKSLELQGVEFLELGHGFGGRGNLGKMHQVVFPQLAKECTRAGIKWDPGRERDEGFRNEGIRMRKLIRQIHDGAQDSSLATSARVEAQPTAVSYPAEAGPALYPDHIPEPRSAGPSSRPNDVNLDHSTWSHTPQSAQSQKQNGMRSVTAPISTGQDSPEHDSPSRESPTWLRADYSRSAMAATSDHRRQSPSVSSDTGPSVPPPFRPHEDSPKSGSPGVQHISPSYPGLTSSSTGDLTLRHDHSRGNSTDSIPGVSRGLTPTTGRYYDARRQGQEGARLSPHDTYSRQWSGESASSVPKEHKGFLHLFKKKSKAHDSSYPSPEEQHLESPTSPEARPSATYLPYSKPGFNSSDMSVGERPSSASVSDQEKIGRGKQAAKAKRWIFATLDGWNFRLVDVSDMESAEALRERICHNLGISDWASAQIYLTEPGQSEHEEPMTDTILALSRRNKSDRYGSLKLFVQGAPVHPGALHASRVDGLGVSIPDKPAISPTATHHLHRKPLDEEALSRISPHHPTGPGSPLLGSRQPTLKASPAKGTRDSSQILDSEKAEMLARHEEHLREVERKQKTNRVSQLPPLQQPRKDAYGENGYRREGVINFDERRASPYEEKKADSLVPFRKPPVAPNESHMLTKVNSLSKRPGDRDRPRTSPSVQTHGLGAVLATVGRMTSAIGTPSPSVPVPASPSTARDSAGSATLDSAATTSSSATLNSTNASSQYPFEQDTQTSPSLYSGQSTAKAVASENVQSPALQSRKSFGPAFEFEETEVSFQRSPKHKEESDDDSDDGLFAIPLANNSNPKPAESETEKQSEDKKPSLTVNTKSSGNKGLNVSFKSPSTGGESFAGPSAHSSGGEASDGQEQSSGTSWHGADSPEDEAPHSFARGDVWASRPPVEGVIENLDNFFPNIDLDAPYLDGPPSPNGRGHADQEATLKGKQEALPGSSNSSHNADSATVRPPVTGFVARRNVGRSGGGLTRMKSIREVAQGANQAHRTKSITSTSPQRSGVPLRRTSTKMFGAKIMQISPKPGSRLSQLDPIPQNSSQTSTIGSVPQRQATFRIIRGQLIGKGTYGRVYLGINADTGEVLAVKQVEINPRIAGTDKDRIKEMVAALDQEIDTMQHLEHPNIVQYLGCERGEFSISIYLEYISGGSIGSCLRKHGKFEESVVRSLTRQTLSGLAYLHDSGILHRDLKADNILLDLDGSCKISDFGISKKTDDIYGNDSTNSMQGSVFWMAPEVIQSQGQGYSAKVDIWSLGCVVLEMFAGRRPWSKEEAVGAIFKLGSLRQGPPIPEDVSMNISPAAIAFMCDCFTVNSSERPTAQTLLTRHPFCEADPNYNFLDTELYAKIRHVL